MRDVKKASHWPPNHTFHFQLTDFVPLEIQTRQDSSEESTLLITDPKLISAMGA